MPQPKKTPARKKAPAPAKTLRAKTPSRPQSPAKPGRAKAPSKPQGTAKAAKAQRPSRPQSPAKPQTPSRPKSFAKAARPSTPSKPQAPAKASKPKTSPPLSRAKTSAAKPAAGFKKQSLGKRHSAQQSPTKQSTTRQSATKQSTTRQRLKKQVSNKQGPGKKSIGAPVVKKNALPSLPQSQTEALRLARNIAQLLLEKKATDVVVFDVHQKSSYADAIVVASGASEPHLASLSKHIWELLKKDNVRPHGVEGSNNSAWVLMDFGDVVVHLFSPEIRALYDLDGLWSDVLCERFR